MSDFSPIEILVLDVDGVLTDGGVYLDGEGAELKRFSILDGLGIKTAIEVGLRIALVSGHSSSATVRRFSALGIDDIHVGVADKLAVFSSILETRGFSTAQACAVGDDLVDIPMLRAAGIAATVPGAHKEVRKVAHYVTSAAGGHGAVREIIERILHARGLFDMAFERYLH